MSEVERTIAADTDRVWQLLSDLDNWDQMLPTMQRVTRLGTKGPLGVGTRFEVQQPGLRRAVYEITDWQPGRGFTWRSTAPGIRTAAPHWLAPQDEGTRLVLGIDWSGPLTGLVRLLLGSKVRRMVEQEADSFTRLAERAGRPD
jgi:carbon monoxide dehydrogenase subunit G